MSCEYCKNGKTMLHNSYSDVKIGKVDGVYRIYFSDGPNWRASYSIRFCPMCGERFPEIVSDSFESIKEDVTLDFCVYAKKRGIGREAHDSDEESICCKCEWNGSICCLEMRNHIKNMKRDGLYGKRGCR